MSKTGKDAGTLNVLFDKVDTEGIETIEAVSMDRFSAFRVSSPRSAPASRVPTICFDVFYADLRIMPMFGPKTLVVAVAAVLRSA